MIKNDFSNWNFYTPDKSGKYWFYCQNNRSVELLQLGYYYGMGTLYVLNRDGQVPAEKYKFRFGDTYWCIYEEGKPHPPLPDCFTERKIEPGICYDDEPIDQSDSLNDNFF